MQARKVSDEDIMALYRQGLNQVEIASKLNVSNVCIHKRLKRLLVPASLEKLTPKERKFCLAVAAGKSRTQAAMESYDVASRASAKALQNTLMGKQAIRESIEILLERKGLSRSRMAEIIAGHAENTADPHVSLKAVDMGLKLTGDYAPEKTVGMGLSFTQINLNITNGCPDERNDD